MTQCNRDHWHRIIDIERGYRRLYAEDGGCCSTINGSVAVVNAAPALLTWKLTYRLARWWWVRLEVGDDSVTIFDKRSRSMALLDIVISNP